MAQKNIFCPRCGKKLAVDEADKRIFCMHCGKNIEIVAPEMAETLEQDAVKEIETPEQLSGMDASVDVTASEDAKTPSEEKKEAPKPETPKPEAPNPFAAMIQAQREIAAEQIKKAEELAAEQRKQENMSAGRVGVLHSEAT